MVAKLTESQHAEISVLCDQGEEFERTGQHELAREKYIAALGALPRNTHDYELATWLYAAVGDICFHMGKMREALKYFSHAVQCPLGMGDPLIHLRLGQLYYEVAYFEKAEEELAKAYRDAGVAIFRDDDPKYFQFLEARIAI
ncbi:tetratricopeptide repeat protein [Chitinimonas sp. PSY-7]|uniref:tetratricopeptide repeat protein n=1 Tax=Chitinimonas sp. PSY-7 TaxID=3459088 RepID=UPI0040401EB4